jgi:hypothetical protein
MCARSLIFDNLKFSQMLRLANLSPTVTLLLLRCIFKPQDFCCLSSMNGSLTPEASEVVTIIYDDQGEATGGSKLIQHPVFEHSSISPDLI